MDRLSGASEVVREVVRVGTRPGSGPEAMARQTSVPVQGLVCAARGFGSRGSRHLFLAAFVLILAASMIFANVPTTVTGSVSPERALLDQTSFLLPAIGALMLIMVVLAAAAYAGGQFFGAETRARANTWAMSMLSGVGVGIAILAVLYLILPNILAGQYTPESANPDVVLTNLIDLVRTGLQVIILGMIVIAAVIYAAGHFFGTEARARAISYANALMAAAMLCSVIYAVLSPILEDFQTSIFQNTVIALYAPLLIRVVYTVTIIILITYAASKLLRQPEWEAYLSIELSNLMSSFLVVLFVLGMFVVGSSITQIWTTNPSPPKAVIVYLQANLTQSILRAVYDINTVNICASVLSTMSKRMGEQVLTQTYKIFPGTDMLVSIINTINFSLVSVLGSVSAQLSLMYLVDSFMLNLFLPAGLVLRFLPPTRDAGCFLIALAFGFQFVYPVTFLINIQVLQDLRVTDYSMPPALLASVCGPLRFATFGFLFNQAPGVGNPIFNMFPGLSSIGRALSLVFNESVVNSLAMPEFIEVMRQISYLSLPALVMPALSMMITISFINTMAKFLVNKT